MANRQAGTEGRPKAPGRAQGWESDSAPDAYRNFSSSGRGATTAEKQVEASVAPANTAATQPEFPPEGWGGPGENYPPTRGPVPVRSDEDPKAERR